MKRQASKNSELKAILRRRYWHAEDAERVLAALASSGDSLTAFAKRHGLHPSRLERWQGWLKPTGSRRPKFHPVRIVPPMSDSEGTPQAETEGFELILAGGRRLVVRRGFDPALLKELVEAVESWSC